MSKAAKPTRITTIAARIAHPWRRSRTISPNVKQRAPGSRRIATSSRKSESGVGFSNGCAELTLKNPPPLVPSCLIAICDAAGPSASVCPVTVTVSVTGFPWASLTWVPAASSFGSLTVTGSRRATFLYAANVCTTPWETSARAKTSESGSRM